MKRITLLEKGLLVENCDRLEIYLYQGGIIQRGENSFEWFHGDSIPFFPTCPYSQGIAATLDEAMRALVRTAMSPS